MKDDAEIPAGSPANLFTATPLERWKKVKESIARAIFLAMTLSLVIPLVGILAILLVKAWPALSVSFLLQNPKDYMTSGGIWAPLVGTFFLVLGSLLAAAPVGILAGVYLNEYAHDNWLTISSTWPWSTWRECPASCTGCSAWGPSCWPPTWDARFRPPA